MNIERALATEGWMSAEELTYLATVAERSRLILEVGSWLGRSTCALAANTKGVVWAVDTWEGGPEQGGKVDRNNMLSKFLVNVEGLPVRPIMMSSKVAAKEISHRRFDMIFIDAAHDYESVKADIIAFSPLLNSGGVFCGHDYHENWPGVIRAVSESFPSYRTVGTIWTTEAAC
jgi:predicted O-methyltransferase YrrM